MTDIVHKLRELIGNCKCIACTDRKEAADEIERQRNINETLYYEISRLRSVIRRYIKAEEAWQSAFKFEDDYPEIDEEWQSAKEALLKEL